MRLILILIFLPFVHADAQKTKAKAHGLSKDQQWLKTQLENFYDKHQVNVSKSAMVRQYTNVVTHPQYNKCDQFAEKEKLKLQGKRINDRTVKLKWEAISEGAENSFIMERLLLNSNSGMYEHVASMKGFGKSLKNIYDLVDLNNYSGNSVYRLRQFDASGKLKFSKTVSVEGFVVPAIIKAIPNPTTSEKIILEFGGFEEEEKIGIMIYDVKGSLVFNRSNIHLKSISNVLHLNGLKLISGVYVAKAVGKSRFGSTTIVIK